MCVCVCVCVCVMPNPLGFSATVCCNINPYCTLYLSIFNEVSQLFVFLNETRKGKRGEGRKERCGQTCWQRDHLSSHRRPFLRGWVCMMTSLSRLTWVRCFCNFKLRNFGSFIKTPHQKHQQHGREVVVFVYLMHKKYSHNITDYFKDALTTFLGLERVSCFAVYGGSESAQIS